MKTAARMTKAELSRALSVERHQLSRILSRPGAPGPDRSKKYLVKAVADFIGTHRPAGLDALREARLQEILLRCEGLRRGLDRDAGRVISIEDHEREIEFISRRAQSRMRQHIEGELPPKVVGLVDVVDVRLAMREGIDAVCLGIVADAAQCDQERAAEISKNQ
jgi:hypothetical protein